MKKYTFPSVPQVTIFAALLAAGALFGCEAKPGATAAPSAAPSAARITSLAEKTKAQLVLVKGGEFQMGDFGEIHSPEKLPYTGERHDGPLHKVSLSDFSMMKYKVTLAEYDTYAAANDLPVAYSTPADALFSKSLRAHPKSATFPVGVDWPDAQSYCRWVGKQLGLSMDLPTEAQWEYAARARGAMLVFATDNGKEEPNRNFPTYNHVEESVGEGGQLPVGMYPPNSLGLYDLGFNGYEWMADWYAEDYYARSPEKNPRGPESGTTKVVRSLTNDGNDHPAKTFQRDARAMLQANRPKSVGNSAFGFRCVAQ
ncbi:MAG: SUMF1/EgtB/PvdO family nonheme iron enzyme [Telluria sp.]